MTQPTKPATQTPPGDAKQQQHQAKQTEGAKKRGRPAGAEAKVWNYTGLDLTLLMAPTDADARLASLAAPVRARDERQMALDGVVKAYHDKWIAAGQPTKWAAMPKAVYHVPPEAADTVRMLVRRGAAFHGVSVKFGKPVRDQQGREIVVFAVRDSRTRAGSADATTFTLEDLRSIATDFFADDPEGLEEFLSILTGENESETEDETDTADN